MMGPKDCCLQKLKRQRWTGETTRGTLHMMKEVVARARHKHGCGVWPSFSYSRPDIPQERSQIPGTWAKDQWKEPQGSFCFYDDSDWSVMGANRSELWRILTTSSFTGKEHHGACHQHRHGTLRLMPAAMIYSNQCIYLGVFFNLGVSKDSKRICWEWVLWLNKSSVHSFMGKRVSAIDSHISIQLFLL